MGIDNLESLLNDSVLLVSYEGVISQSFIGTTTEKLEKDFEEKGLGLSLLNNIITVYIELSQNMMNYSKSLIPQSEKIESKGYIAVGERDSEYFVYSKNIISSNDKKKLEPKLNELLSLDKDQLKKDTGSLEEAVKNTHEKGGGIGLYEIAKRCDKINYSLTQINEDKYYLNFISEINI